MKSNLYIANKDISFPQENTLIKDYKYTQSLVYFLTENFIFIKSVDFKKDLLKDCNKIGFSNQNGQIFKVIFSLSNYKHKKVAELRIVI